MGIHLKKNVFKITLFPFIIARKKFHLELVSAYFWIWIAPCNI